MFSPVTNTAIEGFRTGSFTSYLRSQIIGKDFGSESVLQGTLSRDHQVLRRRLMFGLSAQKGQQILQCLQKTTIFHEIYGG